MSDIKNAKRILASGKYTCVLCKDGKIYTSVLRGVKPLVDWYKSNNGFIGFSAADKVVGKGAAFLYVLMRVGTVYADVISLPALKLLHSYGINVEYRIKTDNIINRTGTGICPFEQAVENITDADTAYRVILKKMQEMGI